MTEIVEQTIAVAATFTAELIEEPLAYWMQELGIQSKINFAPYNQVCQELLDTSRLLSRNMDGINAILIQLENWYKSNDNPVPNVVFSVREQEEIERNVQDLIRAQKSATESSKIPWIVCLCPASNRIIKDKDRVRILQVVLQGP